MAIENLLNLNNDESYIESVRLTLGINDSQVLSDEAIKNDIYFSMAKIELSNILPCIEDSTFTNQEVLKMRLAFTYILASIIAPTLTGMIEYEVKTIDVTWKRKPVNYDDLSITLYNRAKDLVSDFECYVDNSLDTPIFVVAPSKRAVNTDVGE